MNKWLVTLLGYSNEEEVSSALSPHDFLVISAADLPIEHWYDLMKWWVMYNPEYVLHPSIMWACSKRARELTVLIDKRSKARRITQGGNDVSDGQGS